MVLVLGVVVRSGFVKIESWVSSPYYLFDFIICDAEILVSNINPRFHFSWSLILANRRRRLHMLQC